MWQIVNEAEIERERRERKAERKVREADEREREREREREKRKGDNMTEKREKIIKKLIFTNSILSVPFYF